MLQGRQSVLCLRKDAGLLFSLIHKVPCASDSREVAHFLNDVYALLLVGKYRSRQLMEAFLELFNAQGIAGIAQSITAAGIWLERDLHKSTFTFWGALEQLQIALRAMRLQKIVFPLQNHRWMGR